MRYYIGIDNGVSGSIGIVSEDRSVVEFFKTPVLSQQDYTKRKKNISRIDGVALAKRLGPYQVGEDITPFVYVERPMINPGRFHSTISAARALDQFLM